MNAIGSRTLAGMALASLVAAQVMAVEPATAPARTNAPVNNAVAANADNHAAEAGDHHFRTSTIESLRVYNVNGDELGKVKDLVVDMNSGKVLYAALDFGGFLGIGDKYFAVPWHAFKFSSGGNKDKHLVLDITKERLKNAPGFDKSHWPDMADPNWAKPVDQFYGHPATASVR